MQPKSLFWLSFLVAALGAFIYFYERDLPSADQRRERSQKVLELEADDIQALTVAHGTEEARLERRPEGGEEGGEATWRLVEPLETRADAEAVRGLVELLTGLRKQRTLAEFDAEELGLVEPRARIEVETAAGATVLLLGSELPATDSLALAVEGRREVYAVDAALGERVLRPLEQWISRAWTELPAFQVRRLEIETPDRRAVFERGEDFQWRRAEDPAETGDDAEAAGAEDGDLTEAGVADLLYALTEVRGERLLTAEEVAALPASPALVLRLSTVAGPGGEAEGERDELTAYPWNGGWALTSSTRQLRDSPRGTSGFVEALLLPAAATEDLRRSLDPVLGPDTGPLAVSLAP